MAIKPISSPDQRLLALCQQTCDTMKAEYVSMNDIIPRVSEIGFEASLTGIHAMFERFGCRVVRQIQHRVQIEQAVAACDNALDLLVQRGEAEFAHSAAIASTKSGRGECQSLSLIACSLLHERSPIMVTIRNPANALGTTASQKWSHVFALLGVSLDEIAPLVKDKNILQIFDALGKGVILDVTLSCVCLVAEYRTKATKLLEYIEKFQAHKVSECLRVLPDSMAGALQEAERVWQVAQPLIPTMPLTPHTLILNRGACLYLANNVMPYLTQLTQSRFPAIKWKNKIDDKRIEWRFWTQGPVAQVQAVGEHLKSIGAKVSADKVKKQEETYAIIFKDPDPLELSVLFATEQIFASAIELPSDKKPGKLANIIARYAEK